MSEPTIITRDMIDTMRVQFIIAEEYGLGMDDVAVTVKRSYNIDTDENQVRFDVTFSLSRASKAE